ncbi:uncharacterized protein LOC114526168 isoform X1 [Dendronephthya gigantea]|uniref:uncharacterized protein LOC114526168 isoform X1 n=1 Tax=Dendronephthya gigantea TaxID=151771 RepID=UPI001069FAAF|nr:uncharacterized protein LOC114526168 isoform X1 [Dendronephthya gigantea]
MGLSREEFKVRKAVLDLLSEILPVYDQCLTVYHKSLWDWLTLNGFEEHAFVADVDDGNRRLWRACKKQFCEIDALKSVLEFQISPENRYALENGWKYLVDTGEVEEFHWLVHVGINFLKLKFCPCRIVYFDFSGILGTYCSKLSKDIYLGIIQLHCFFKILRIRKLFGSAVKTDSKDHCYVYLQALANGHFDFLQSGANSKSGARDILGATNEIWIEYVTTESNSNLSIVPEAVFTESLRFTSVSPDNTILACVYLRDQKVQMLKIPELTTIFEAQLTKISPYFQLSAFSPDSSYFLCTSIRFCINIKEKKEVPFITHGPDHIIYCSFSSCGMKLVTLEKTSIKVWDVKNKNILVEVENVYGARSYCLFSNCNSYILLWPMGQERSGSSVLDYTNVLNSETLKKINNKNIRVDQNLSSSDSFQIFPPPYSGLDLNVRMKMNYIRLPCDQTVLISNKYCSKVFLWKNRKCVAFTNDFKNSLALAVYDFINQKIVDVFEIGCLPCDTSVKSILKLDGTSFLLSLGCDLVLVSSLDWPDATFVDNAEIDCRALSPDTLYVACCFENCLLSIRSVDSGETLQTVALERRALTCWWSESYLWLVCGSLVVKYRYEPTSENIFGSQHAEFIGNL